MNNPTSISTADAMKLRAQALELLRKAEQLDGLKAHGIPAYNPLTLPVFILWSTTKITQDMAFRIYDARIDENDGRIKPIALEDICGVSAISRTDGQESA